MAIVCARRLADGRRRARRRHAGDPRGLRRPPLQRPTARSCRASDAGSLLSVDEAARAGRACWRRKAPSSRATARASPSPSTRSASTPTWSTPSSGSARSAEHWVRPWFDTLLPDVAKHLRTVAKCRTEGLTPHDKFAGRSDCSSLRSSHSAPTPRSSTSPSTTSCAAPSSSATRRRTSAGRPTVRAPVLHMEAAYSDPLEKDRDTYVVNRDGSGLRKLSDDEKKDAPPAGGESDARQAHAPCTRMTATSTSGRPRPESAAR